VPEEGKSCRHCRFLDNFFRQPDQGPCLCRELEPNKDIQHYLNLIRSRRAVPRILSPKNTMKYISLNNVQQFVVESRTVVNPTMMVKTLQRAGFV
jgi:hypothetical protein